MGQAKLRGTYEQRKAAAIAKKAARPARPFIGGKTLSLLASIGAILNAALPAREPSLLQRLMSRV